MSSQSLFSKKNIEAQQPDTRTGLMEELNLPPAVISFVRKNANNLQIGLIVLVVLVLAWVFYDYYTEKQESDAASLLASAMQTEATDQRVQILESVVDRYSRTDGALWSRLELAHLDYQAGRYDAAIEKYERLLAKVSDDNPLVPLVRMNLAQSFEETEKYDRAIAQYATLKNITGFKQEAYLGLGRTYTANNEPAKARKEYEEFLGTMEEETDPQLKALVEALLVSAGDGKTVPAHQPEGNKE